MPELPEVETMRRGLLPIIGRTIEQVAFPTIPYRPIAIYPSRDKLLARCRGKKIVSVERIAKRVSVVLDSMERIVLQPKMAGMVMVSAPPSSQHTRIIFHLCGRKSPRQFLYWDRRGLGTVCLWTPEEFEQSLGSQKLGPDALLIDAATFAFRLGNCRKEIKCALLDQRVISGIGNIYAAEILFASKVHPTARCHEISRFQYRRMFANMIRILQEAIEREGSTLSDGSYRSAINGEASYQNEHKVYDREDKVCLGCRKHKIVRIVQAQRSTYFCPGCQKFW